MKYLFALLIFCLIPGVSTASVRDGNIVYSNGKLSIKLNQVTLRDVITSISDKTGTSIFIFDDAAQNKVTVDFKNRSFKSALRSVLRGVNYAVVYEDGFKNGSVTWIEGTGRKNGMAGIKSSGRVAVRSGSGNTKAAARRAVNSGTSSSRSIGTTVKNISSTYQTVRPDKSITNTAAGTVVDYRYGGSGSSTSITDSTADNQYTSSDSEDDSDILAENTGENAEISEKADMPVWYEEGMSEKELFLRGKIDVLERQIESGYADRQYDHWVKLRGSKIVRHASELIEEYEGMLQKMSPDDL